MEEATAVIQILAVVGVIQSLHTLNAEVLLALGRAGTLVRFTVLWFAATSPPWRSGAVGNRRRRGRLRVATLLIEPIRAYITTQALGIPLRGSSVSLSGSRRRRR